MPNELSAKDQVLKEQIERSLKGIGPTFDTRGRRLMGILPSDPRCATCLSPFEGVGGVLVGVLLNKKRSTSNPLMCGTCEDMIKRLRYGTELEMGMLFADIRGSTSLAENMPPSNFRNLIDRFYSETTHVLVHSYAIIDKLAGDEVSGFFIPGMAGEQFAQRAVEAAQQLLQVTGHADAEGPWVPVGVGVHVGTAYFGAVSSMDGLVELTALGDAVNVASRLASQAAAGEVVISERTAQKAGVNLSDLEMRTLELKGKGKPVDVWVMRVGEMSAISNQQSAISN